MLTVLAIVALVALAAGAVYASKPDVGSPDFRVPLMPKFLSTFSAFDGTAATKVTFKGVNNAAPLLVEHELQQALANTDTLTLKAPAGYEDWVPQLIGVWSNAAPRVPQTNIALTNHNASTGVTTLTASGAVADSSTVLLAYFPCTLGT